MKICISIAYLVLLIIFIKTCHSHIPIQNHCPPSSCGNLHNISFPFRLTTDHKHCGKRDYELSCENNRAFLNIRNRHKLFVKEIIYDNYTIRVIDPDFHSNDCSSVPKYSLGTTSFYRGARFETEMNYYLADHDENFCSDFLLDNFNRVLPLTETAIFLTCEKPIKSSRHHNYIDRSPCINSYSTSAQYSYVVLNEKLSFSDLENSCRVDKVTQLSSRNELKKMKKKGTNYTDVYRQFLYGFELSWVQAFSSNGSHCYIDLLSNMVHCHLSCARIDKVVFGAAKFIEAGLFIRMGIIIPLFVIMVDTWRKRHLSMYNSIEQFLRNHNNSMPKRYSDWEITRMTNGFKDKLGEGGFGLVYKGKLCNGQLVAVKVLGKSKANGQDFINEVSTIGRVYHVNVVQLIGFFYKGSNRSLIYEYMPNGSLDKYIFSREGIHNSLSRKELFHISLGVAHGIEYLHRGCDMRILHFDIKPHNILLDENFVPKVSDFGLARVCPSDNSMVSLTAARGTIGYIAPELFYKNIGGVSHKADVYSFGMLLMEMANRRKNLNVYAEKSSEIYFPLWIFDQFSKGNGVDMIEDATKEESEMIKKMIIVALWCIQLKPSDRPSMSKVIEMLEGEVESLKIPPKPYLYPQEQDHDQEKRDVEEATESSGSSTQPSVEDCSEISLISNAC